jgi:hypothetical protein
MTFPYGKPVVSIAVAATVLATAAANAFVHAPTAAPTLPRPSAASAASPVLAAIAIPNSIYAAGWSPRRAVYLSGSTAATGAAPGHGLDAFSVVGAESLGDSRMIAGARDGTGVSTLGPASRPSIGSTSRHTVSASVPILFTAKVVQRSANQGVGGGPVRSDATSATELAAGSATPAPL